MMRNRQDGKPWGYKLVDGQEIPIYDFVELAEWYSDRQHDMTRQVASTHVGDVFISTVLLTFPDERPYLADADGQPLLDNKYETMFFGGYRDSQVFARYPDLEQARLGHERAVGEVKQALGITDNDK